MIRADGFFAYISSTLPFLHREESIFRWLFIVCKEVAMVRKTLVSRGKYSTGLLCCVDIFSLADN